jgi:G6PDH family F420-dependent oxidoreductase
VARYGYFLSSEEYGPAEIVRQARLAEEAGFDALAISDHFHPWLDEQGESGFVWSMIGAISQVTSLPVITLVTCPTMRTPPAMVAHAAATSAILTGGRFTLGVGSGEALNEHITGQRWPSAGERLEMLSEAVTVIRELFSGRLVSHRGPHYTVETARLYSRPAEAPPIYVSGFGEKASQLAGEIGDGFITMHPTAGLVRVFRESGGGDKTAVGGLKVTEDMVTAPCGPDTGVHVDAIREYLDAGFDEVYVQQVGGSADGFFEFYAGQVLPQLPRDSREA